MKCTYVTDILHNFQSNDDVDNNDDNNYMTDVCPLIKNDNNSSYSA